jgi:uncharacterized protein (TIGR03435 family)
MRSEIMVGLAVVMGFMPGGAVFAQTFAAASIRPSTESVQFEHDGKTETSPGNLTMRDVTVATCIKWAFGVQDSQIAGPEWLQSEHFDILAKADERVGDDQLKTMMRALLAERFKLAVHRQSKELSSYALTVAKGGTRMKEAAADAKPSRQNSEMGTVAKATTMREFGDFLSGVLKTPVVDQTGLSARYDFAIDFTSYVQADVQAGRRPDTVGILLAALQGERGLKLESKKENVDVLVIDHVQMPSEN